MPDIDPRDKIACIAAHNQSELASEKGFTAANRIVAEQLNEYAGNSSRQAKENLATSFNRCKSNSNYTSASITEDGSIEIKGLGLPKDATGGRFR